MWLKQSRSRPNKTASVLALIEAALGGGPGRQGIIYKSTIIKVVKEFELTIEIEAYFDLIGIDDDEMTFEDFCKLFECPGENSIFYMTYKSFKSVIILTRREYLCFILIDYDY